MKKTDTTSTLGLTKVDLDIIKSMLGQEASEEHFQRFIRTCERTGLDPITRQIYGRIQRTNKRQKRGNEWVDNWVPELVIITGIDGFRAVAERTGQYLGQTTPEFFFKDSSMDLEAWEWRDFWIGNGSGTSHPEVARVGIRRIGFPEPVYGVARYNSYVQFQGSGQDKKLTPFWYKMPEVLLAKCAEGLGFRKAFPILSGLYLEEEVSADKQDDEDVPTATAAPVIERETVRIIKKGEKIEDPPRKPVVEEAKEEDNIPGLDAEPPDALFETDVQERAKATTGAAALSAPMDPPTTAGKTAKAPATKKATGQPAAPAETAAPSWRDHKVEQLRVGKFCGRTLGDLAKNPVDIKAAFEGWAQKYFPQLKSDAAKRHEAEMMLAAYIDTFPEDKANHVLEK